MSLINIAKVIRTAIMAKDVRENIAKGFEEANSSINKVDGKIGNKDSELDNWMSNRNTEFENWKNATNENIDYRLNAQNMNIASNAEKIESVEKKVDAITDEVRNARHVCLAGCYKMTIPVNKTITPIPYEIIYNKVGYDLKGETSIKLKKDRLYKIGLQFAYNLKSSPSDVKLLAMIALHIQKDTSAVLYEYIGRLYTRINVVSDNVNIEYVFSTKNMDSGDLNLNIMIGTYLDIMQVYSNAKLTLYELTTC